MAKSAKQAKPAQATQATPIALKVPKAKEKKLKALLVEHGVPEDEIQRLGGPGGFLSKLLGGVVGGQYPLLSKLIQILITKGISSLGG